ncbi:hypothetical protein GC176_00235 [bacterium]|nr:hypothetical protein [bacterium]
MNERELFLAALDIDDPAERQAHLQAACADDAELLSRVESLLASHDAQSQFLDTPVVEQIANDPAIKVEAHAQGTNRRAIVTSRPRARVLPAAAYDDRGGSDRHRRNECGCATRNKELKADRLSDHHYMANLFRLALHCAAHNLLTQLRRVVTDPVEWCWCADMQTARATFPASSGPAGS